MEEMNETGCGTGAARMLEVSGRAICAGRRLKRQKSTRRQPGAMGGRTRLFRILCRPGAGIARLIRNCVCDIKPEKIG